MTPQILLYNITDPERKKKIKGVLLRLRVRARIIEKEAYADPIGRAAGMDVSVSTESNTPADDFNDEMLVFCFFSDSLLNQFLLGMRKAGVQIPLKAILTPSNCSWNSYMLHQEISAEHQRMHSQDTSSDISPA